jgi:hypothetical protein
LIEYRFFVKIDNLLVLSYTQNMSIESQLMQEYLQNDLESQLIDYKLFLVRTKLKYENWSNEASTERNKKEFKREAEAIGKI